MAQKPETAFIRSINSRLSSSIYRMKNHNEYNAGVPDCWYSGPNGDLWVEYKFIRTPPKRLDTKLDFNLTTLQSAWLTERANEGRNVAVMVGCGKQNVLLLTHPDQWRSAWNWERFLHSAISRDDAAQHIIKRVSG